MSQDAHTQNGCVFRSKNRGLATAAREILEAEKPMTLRQLYYRLISAGHLQNADQEYKRLGSVMTRLREDEVIPRTWLVDHTRATLKPSSWSGLADFGEDVRRCYRKDFWAAQECDLHIFVEKDAVAGTIQPVTREYDVPLHVCRGYASISFAGEIADQWAEGKKDIHAYYLGDFDPSGFDLERDLRQKLSRYSGLPITNEYGEILGEDYDAITVNGWSFDAFSRDITWTRLGVRDSDFADHTLIELPVKKTDKRAAGFIRKHGKRCAEIDAIPPTVLRERVRNAILSHINTEAWEGVRAVEAIEQETIAKVIKRGFKVAG